MNAPAASSLATLGPSPGPREALAAGGIPPLAIAGAVTPAFDRELALAVTGTEAPARPAHASAPSGTRVLVAALAAFSRRPTGPHARELPEAQDPAAPGTPATHRASGEVVGSTPRGEEGEGPPPHLAPGTDVPILLSPGGGEEVRATPDTDAAADAALLEAPVAAPAPAPVAAPAAARARAPAPAAAPAAAPAPPAAASGRSATAVEGIPPAEAAHLAFAVAATAASLVAPAVAPATLPVAVQSAVTALRPGPHAVAAPRATTAPAEAQPDPAAPSPVPAPGPRARLSPREVTAPESSPAAQAVPAPRARELPVAPALFHRAPTFHARAVDRDLASATALASGRTIARQERAERRDERSRPEPAQQPQAPAAAQAQPAPAAPTAREPSAPPPAARPVAPPPEPPATATLLGQTAAHVRLTSDTLGDVALHLRLRDGAATVRLEADAPGDLGARAPELARALAAEGLTLARLDVERREPAPAPAPARQDGSSARSSPDGHGRQDRPAHDEAPPPGPRTPRSPSTQPRPRRSGHDVTA